MTWRQSAVWKLTIQIKRQAEAIAEKEAEQRTDEERAILDKKDANSASAEQLEELFAKLVSYRVFSFLHEFF